MEDNFAFKNCLNCGFMMPENYDFCPCCVYGIEPNKIGRVLCRNCNTTVGEHYILPNEEYHKLINKCDYCDPIDPKDDDVVGRFHFWSFSPDKKPKKTLVETTREQRRKQIESSEKFAKWLMQIEKEWKEERNNK